MMLENTTVKSLADDFEKGLTFLKTIKKIN